MHEDGAIGPSVQVRVKCSGLCPPLSSMFLAKIQSLDKIPKRAEELLCFMLHQDMADQEYTGPCSPGEEVYNLLC